MAFGTGSGQEFLNVRLEANRLDDLGDGSIGPNGSLIDPRSKQADLFSGERVAFTGLASGWRHEHFIDQPSGHEDDRTLGTVSGLDSGAVVVGHLESAFPGIHAVFPFLLIGAVTLETGRLEQRINLRFEVHRAFQGRWQFGQLGWRDWNLRQEG